MNRRYLGLLWVVAAIGWLYLLAAGYGSVPALGRVLDPNSGLWSHRPVPLADAVLPGLTSPVHIAIDQHGVPHLFADNEADLYRAQGYLMASQRPFQMDLSTRMPAGRLSEWVGPPAEKLDRFFISFGMRSSARAGLEALLKDPQTAAMLKSFAAGVNRYIATMPQLPPEYVLLGQRPEPFDELKILYMAKGLTFNLAGRSFDLWLEQIRRQIGTEKTLALFPEDLPDDLEDFIGYQADGLPREKERPELFAFQAGLERFPYVPQPVPGQGSNNWAVGPKKSATGHSIFANDTHLGLSLPNVWYENQLSVPAFNVYGVALAAIPGIVLGLNRQVAWGPTNGTTDVLDFYEIEFENETSLRYRHKGEWKTAAVQEEALSVKGGRESRLQVITTELGPVLHREGSRALAADWAGHRAGRELAALRNLYEAKDYAACLRGFEPWQVPLQNFICADEDNISIQHTGFIPRRPVGHGRFVMDGRTADPLMKAPGEIGLKLVNPSSGFVLSANQKPVRDNSAVYLGWDFEDPFRGMTIRQRLMEKAKLSPEDLIRMQNDAHDEFAALALPEMMKDLRAEDLPEAFVSLRKWNFTALAEGTESAVFRAWYTEMKRAIFAEVYEDVPLLPKDTRVIQMLREGVDRDLRIRALTRAVAELKQQFGELPSWTRYNGTELRHVARIPGFGSGLLPMAGSGDSIRGNKGRHGAVYKLVAALGPELRAWIQVPGHNNGDPFSPDYTRHVRPWAEGKMREVEFYRDLKEARARAKKVVVFSPEAR